MIGLDEAEGFKFINQSGLSVSWSLLNIIYS